MDEVSEKSNFLQAFWSLSSVEEDERSTAARDVLAALRESQDQSEEGVCPRVVYALKRLVRGLASNRKGARHGFYVAFTEVLVQFPMVPLSDVFELIDAHLVNTHGLKGQEERGAFFGRVFASLALLQSGRLTETDDIVYVAKQLTSCGQSKAYLREICAVGVGQLVEKCCSADVSRDHVIPLLGIDAGWDGCSPERLYAILHLNTLYRKEKWFKNILKTHWECKHVSSHRNFPKMAGPLLESSSSHPRQHSVWPLVLAAVRDKGHFGSFWKIVVDDSLFTSSHERKFLGFSLLESVLPSLSVPEIAAVFTPNLMRCLVNNASTSTNYLHPAAKHLLSSLSECLEGSKDQSMQTALLIHLQRETGGKFDQLTGSSITSDILATLDVSGVSKLLNHLMELFCNPISSDGDKDSDDTEGGHSVQTWCLDQILSVVRNRRLPLSDSLLLSAGKFLLVHAFFSVEDLEDSEEVLECKVVAAPLELPVQTYCVQKFSSILSDLATISLKYGDSHVGHPGLMEDGGYFITALVSYVRNVLSKVEGKHVLLAQPFSEQVEEAWITVSGVVEELTSKDSLLNEEKAFLLLFSATGLQLLIPENRDKMAESIQELKVCYDEMRADMNSRFKTPKKRSKKSSKAPVSADDDDSPPTWVEVLTDMLLGFLSQPSQMWRGVAEQVFRHVTSHVTLKCLQLILGVLEPEKSSEELMEEDKGEEDEEEEEKEEEDDEEEEKEEEDEAAGSGSDDDESSSDESEGGNHGDDVDEGVDPAFRAEIEEALGAAVIKSDEESESSLDDDAMMAVDEALAAAFRKRFALKHQKKEKKELEKSVVHFKLRVLDLIEMFIRKESTNPLILDLVVPLYELVLSSQSRRDSAPIVNRTSRLFKSRLCHLKECPKVGLDVDHIHSQLSKLTQYLYKANANTAQLLIQGTMFLIRVLRGCSAPPTISPLTTRSGRKRKEREQPPPSHGLLNVTMVTEWFGDALSDFMNKKNSNVPPQFFTSYIQRYPDLAALLTPKILQHLPHAANHFRKTQAYEMLHQLKALESGNRDSITAQLSAEDVDVLVAMATKTKKRKHSKHH